MHKMRQAEDLAARKLEGRTFTRASFLDQNCKWCRQIKELHYPPNDSCLKPDLRGDECFGPATCFAVEIPRCCYHMGPKLFGCNMGHSCGAYLVFCCVVWTFTGIAMLTAPEPNENGSKGTGVSLLILPVVLILALTLNYLRKVRKHRLLQTRDQEMEEAGPTRLGTAQLLPASFQMTSLSRPSQGLCPACQHAVGAADKYCDRCGHKQRESSSESL
eukprot:571617-Rhodomonas_salina.2